MRNPLPNCACHELQKPTVTAEGPNHPCWHLEQMMEPEAPTTGLRKCHRSLKNNKNMEISPEGMHVTQRSHQGNCRKIPTDKHTPPRSSTTLGDKPITPGAVIAAPLQTAPSWLGDRAFTGDKQPPGHADCHTSCKNTLPQAPRSETALTGKEHPALALCLPPR